MKINNVYIEIFKGVSIPFIGTLLGAGCVFFVFKKMSQALEDGIRGFSAGVMTAASVWSLLIPSMELSANEGIPVVIPAAGGFICGIVFFLLCDRIIRKRTPLSQTSLPMIAVAVHNLPEGMAVGAMYAELLCGASTVGFPAALALSIGIAVQNFPEGAIVSMPLYSEGMGKGKAFFLGALSGAVEPIGAVLTILAAGLAVPLLPYLLSFAAGAMIYAVLEEISESAANKGISVFSLTFAFGFALMMSLDVLLG